MASFSLKDYSTVSSYPRALSSIIISVGLLAVFITFASWILLSHPIGSVVRGYFYEGDPTSGLASPVDWNNGRGSEVHGSDQLNLVNTQLPKVEGAGEVGQIQNSGDRHKSEVSVSSGYDKVVQEQENENPLTTNSTESFGKSGIVGSEAHDNDNSDVVGTQLPNTEGVGTLGQIRNTGDSQESDFSVSPGNGTMVHAQDNENPVLPKIKESAENGSTGVVSQKPEEPVLSGNGTVSREQDKENLLRSQNEESADIGLNDASTAGLSEAEDSHSNMDSKGSVESECDLFHGEWFYDSAGPAYTNNTCPVITQMQNCQGNGRPDNEYESWRWKPYQCELPRFNATKFLKLMSGKTLAFVGDSVARNQMESLLCLLWQVEVPKNRGNRHMQRWYFRSKSVMIVRIWSSWLVHQTSAPFKNLPEGVAKLHLDVPDETFMQYIPNFDVVVLSSGHWFAKQSIYLLNYDIVGTQLWSPPNHQPLKVNNVEAFGISVETSIAAMATHPNYTGLTILRSYSPDHYEGGAWNTGGSCTGKVNPVLPGKLVENGFTNTMHEKQVTGFHRGIKKQTNRSKLKLMDITDVFSYRHDGHPGPYRSPDPNKITKRGPDGKPPPQDCLHWCMPGPVDTWNELVLEIIRREFEGVQNHAS